MGPWVPFASGGYESGCVLNSLRKRLCSRDLQTQDPAAGRELPAGRLP